MNPGEEDNDATVSAKEGSDVPGSSQVATNSAFPIQEDAGSLEATGHGDLPNFGSLEDNNNNKSKSGKEESEEFVSDDQFSDSDTEQRLSRLLPYENLSHWNAIGVFEFCNGEQNIF